VKQKVEALEKEIAVLEGEAAELARAIEELTAEAEAGIR
jgi:prefoldin subunit 5